MPKEWGPKIIRKIQASNEVLHKVVGSIDTPEKFQAKRAHRNRPNGRLSCVAIGSKRQPHGLF